MRYNIYLEAATHQLKVHNVSEEWRGNWARFVISYLVFCPTCTWANLTLSAPVSSVKTKRWNCKCQTRRYRFIQTLRTQTNVHTMFNPQPTLHHPMSKYYIMQELDKILISVCSNTCIYMWHQPALYFVKIKQKICI